MNAENATTPLLERGRTHTCGDLRGSDVGSTVVLMGWVDSHRDLGGAIFVNLRDRYGVTQLVWRTDRDSEAAAQASELKPEYCVGVEGKVLSRGDNINTTLPTGEVEIEVQRLEVFSKSETPPFVIQDEVDAKEALRLRYRYLDLRRPALQKTFITRSMITQTVRSYLAGEHFIEVETPFLVKNTPGGARNFLVPSRHSAHDFYALAESPQLYKQLLMVAGYDRYFQIVRCFRDEDFRGDRQPEFTQVDIELSFAREELVYQLFEGLMSALFREVLGKALPTPFPRMTFREAMARYGSDKPDLRFGLELTTLTDLSAGCGFRVFDGAVESGGVVKALRLPGRAAALSRKDLDGLNDKVKPVGAKGVAWIKVKDDGSWQGAAGKALTNEARAAFAERLGCEAGDCVLFVADAEGIVDNALNTLRLSFGERFGLIDHDEWRPLWITEFPLFERNEEGAWAACHHPFTSPLPEDIPLIADEERRGEVRSRAYDLVLNGVEIAGGSIRIHQEEVQAKVFAALGMTPKQANEKFQFLLEAFRYGPPPHGGIAMGLDRLVMLFCGATSLRDVIAFPKTQRGACAMTGSPSGVEAAQLKELHIQLAGPGKTGSEA
ncbi:MAG: aspartate--tRNA ligase [Proteobacteria bacterium]|nr:MAG: aspartate--tRNA ligase [Pseudomonadota bacterium]PIE19208.1 MAG: aspartate--tRNA ligase [Pseudomonadota bacterium]